MSDDPILCVFREGGLFPRSNSAAARLHDALGDGELVGVTLDHFRSDKSHRHQFAHINDLWATLPEWMADKPFAANPDALRKHALIATGYANTEVIVTDSAESARRIAAFVGDLARRTHGYCVVEIDKRIVRVTTPHSQSKKAMGAKAFQDSKTAVLEWIEGLLEREKAA